MNAGTFVFQSSGHPSRFSKDVCNAGFDEERHGVLEVFIEIGVEDALVHEMQSPCRCRTGPTEGSGALSVASIGGIGDRLLDGLAIIADRLLSSRFDLRDDGKAVAGWSLGKDWAVRPCSSLKYPSFGIAIACGFVQSRSMVDVEGVAGATVATGRSI